MTVGSCVGRSVSGLIVQRRLLKSVLEVLGGVGWNGVVLSRSLELGDHREAVVRAGPREPLCWGDLAIGLDMGPPAVHIDLGTVLRDVVVHRRDVAVRSLRTWIFEDPLVHLYRWLRLVVVPPDLFFFLAVVPVSRLVSCLIRVSIMSNSGRHGFPLQGRRRDY